MFCPTCADDLQTGVTEKQIALTEAQTGVTEKQIALTETQINATEKQIAHPLPPAAARMRCWH